MDELTEAPAPPKASPARPAISKPPPSGGPQSGLRARSGNSLPADLDIDLDGGAPAKGRSIPPPPPPANTEAAPLAIGKLGRSKVFADEPQAQQISQPPPPPPLWDEDDPSISLEDKPARNGASAAVGFSKPAPTPTSRAANVDPSAEARGSLHDPFAGLELDAEGGPQAPLNASDPALARLPSAPPKQSDPPPTVEERSAVDSEPPAPPKTARRQLVSSALTGLISAALALLLAVGPSAFLTGHFSDFVGAGDLVAVQEATGLYDTVSGRPVFFVRGRIENRGKGVSGPVRIVATLVGEHGTTAKAESLAGAQPNPEDVYGLRSTADADKLLKALAAKPVADRRLQPGSSLPFLALFTDPPADLSGQRVQLRLESAETATSR